MNSWLQFTSHTVSRAFEAHSAKSFASKSSSMLTASFLAQFSYLILQVIHLSLAEHEAAYDYHLYTAICVLIFCIASIIGFILHRKYPFLDNYSTYTVGLPALLNLVGVYELFMALGLKDTERRTIEFGLVYFQIFLSVTLLSIPKIWYQKSVLAFGCSVYMLVRKADSYTVQLGLTNSFLCLMITIALTLGFYKFERHDKMSFIDHHKATTQEKILTNLLDGLPEGILVVDKAKKVYYCNHAMHVVLDTDENHEEIFEKIQDLHIDQIVDEIEKLEDMTLFDGFSGHFFNGPSPRRKHYSESPEKTLEADSPGLEPIIKRRARAGNTMENARLSKLFNGKNSFHNSQEYEKTRVNVSTTLGSPMKKNSDLGKRLREESVHSADLLAVAPKRSAYKKGSSGYFPLETHFRMDFDDEKFKGYAGNPVSALDYKLFNLHGKYLRKCKDMLTENEWQQCAYEVKVREMEIDDQLFKVFIISDISIREKLANLEENSKFKNLMFASLSHEFRTPLNGIYSMLEVATKQVKDTSVVKNYLTPAFVNTHLLLHLVNDMLDYSMVMAGKLLLSLKKFSLHDCLKEVLDLIEPQALLKNLDLSLKISSSIPKKIRSDKVRVQQVLVNLLNNATKFTSKGSIEIKIEQDPTRGHLLRVSVEDTGVGISESDISKLNRLISQLDVTEKISHNSTGIGMGLMMSQALALALGPPGEESTGIQIDSEYGKGSVFKFTVYNHDSVGTLEDVGSFPTLPDERSPRSHNRTDFLTTIFNPKQGIKHIHNIGKKKSQRNVILQKSQQQQQPPQIFECQCPKVLVVDDTAYNILALQTQLSAMGVVSDVAYNGQEAVNKICDEYKKRSSCCQGYKLVLMDCNMPVLDGYEATRKIRIKLERKELAPLTVIGCTAYTDKALLDQGLQCGMEDCITKPIKAKDLKKFLEDYGVTKKSQDLIKS